MVRLPTASQKTVLLDPGSYPSVSSYLNQTWTWNGTDWASQSPNAMSIDPNGPLPGRINSVMAYDGTNVMLFGGQSSSSTGGVLEDTWTWNGTAWTQQSPANPPFGRYLAEACQLTISSGHVVMFGGFGGAGNGQIITETWDWNGSTKVWTLDSSGGTSATPAGRVGHCMDGGTSYLVMFGGQNAPGNAMYNDTWTFNGTNWSQLSPATSPSVRTGASMAYDQTHNVWVMFGGKNYYNYLPETWIFNGTTWTQQNPTNYPAGLVWTQMCWDSQTGTVLLFGGQSATTNYPSNQTWSWNGTTWTQL
jgi:hypothetical protein